jgi:hypothetical protein
MTDAISWGTKCFLLQYTILSTITATKLSRDIIEMFAELETTMVRHCGSEF